MVRVCTNTLVVRDSINRLFCSKSSNHCRVPSINRRKRQHVSSYVWVKKDKYGQPVRCALTSARFPWLRAKHRKIYWVSNRVRTILFTLYSIRSVVWAEERIERASPSARGCVYVHLSRNSCRRERSFQSRLYLVELLVESSALSPPPSCFEKKLPPKLTPSALPSVFSLSFFPLFTSLPSRFRDSLRNVAEV